MKKFEVTLIGTYINKVIEANSAKEAKDKFKAELRNAKGCPERLRLKCEPLEGFFA
jgi:hypothetical protein